MQVNSIKNLTLKNNAAISKLAVSDHLETIAVVQDINDGSSILSLIEEQTQKVIYTDYCHQTTINSIHFNNNIICIAKSDNMVNLIDCQSLKSITSFKVENRVSTIKIYEDLLLISGKRLEIWNWKQKKMLWFLDHYVAGSITETWSYEALNCHWDYSDYLKKQPYINLPALGAIDNKKNEILICGNNTAKLILMSWLDNKVKKVVLNAPLQINHLTTSKTGEFILASGKIPDGEFLWKSKSYKRHLVNLFNEHFKASNVSVFHPNEKSLARGFLNGHVIINKLSDGELLYMEKLHQGKITGLCYNKMGDTLYSSGIDGEIKMIKFDS